MNITKQFLLGLDDKKMIYAETFSQTIHSELVNPLEELYSVAKKEGFELAIASGYRSFIRQLHIWNQKATGLRPLLDELGNPLDASQLSDDKKMFAILRWSALPGASRHHWGCDIDVYDKSTIDESYKLQLSLSETQGNGPFASFHQWLSQHLLADDCGFFRPYTFDKGGIAPEPWHLSYAPLSSQFYAEYTIDILHEQIIQSDIELKQSILSNLDEIYERFIKIN